MICHERPTQKLKELKIKDNALEMLLEFIRWFGRRKIRANINAGDFIRLVSVEYATFNKFIKFTMV
ncbi:hypothetical protein TSUD_109520 [Trifolium subterraneum]|nr:hypothetical protein TSUD_109520 [Trifolium subterraneum]